MTDNAERLREELIGALFDKWYGGTSDPMLNDQLPAVCAENVDAVLALLPPISVIAALDAGVMVAVERSWLDQLEKDLNELPKITARVVADRLIAEGIVKVSTAPAKPEG